jgi:deoxyribodipyrimidine photolyase-related protein
MKKIALVFPNQLFADGPVLSGAGAVFLLEHPRFFSQFNFHKQKLLFHRASMKAYAARLSRKHVKVHYIEHAKLREAGGLAQLVEKKRVTEIAVTDACDFSLRDELQETARQLGAELTVAASPQFLCDAPSLETFFRGRKHLSMASFYRQQRKRLGVLVEDGKPAGSKWSFDADNRRRLPADISIPVLPEVPRRRRVAEACRYVLKHFPDHPGSVDDFFYPVTHADAKRWLRDFLEQRLAQFGPYEDAICRQEGFLFHSLLSPLINAGLLTPSEVVEQTLNYSREHDVPLNSLEGFLRQVIGWREFMRAVYLLIGNKERTANFWGCQNELPAAFYQANTGIEPVDTVIKRVHRTAFAHHIERLMILGNFFLLCEIRPDEVYRWFMELFIDAYDWVMVPNVYGMSQYADGGRITTKPYISSSNYVRKMSDFPNGSWCDVWDALFWRFIHKHKKVFAGNPRMRVMAVQVERMDSEKLDKHLSLAQRYLETLFR